MNWVYNLWSRIVSFFIFSPALFPLVYYLETTSSTGISPIVILLILLFVFIILPSQKLLFFIFATTDNREIFISCILYSFVVIFYCIYVLTQNLVDTDLATLVVKGLTAISVMAILLPRLKKNFSFQKLGLFFLIGYLIYYIYIEYTLHEVHFGNSLAEIIKGI